jgi:serine/threonine protein kinase
MDDSMCSYKQRNGFKDKKKVQRTIESPQLKLSRILFTKKNSSKLLLAFINMLNNSTWDDYISSQYKELYRKDDNFYSIEECTIKHYRERSKLMKLCSNMMCKNFMLIPEDMTFIEYDVGVGLVIQRMEYCELGELWEFVANHTSVLKQSKPTNFDVDYFVFGLSQTLKELHTKNIFLMDIKLENIFGKYTGKHTKQWKFADFEYAFIDTEWLITSQLDEKDTLRAFKKSYGRRWIRTLEYCPDNSYPYTRRIAERNDVYAFCRVVAIVVSAISYGQRPRMFWDTTIGDQRREWHDQDPDLTTNPYIKICGDVLFNPNKCANDSVLHDFIKISCSVNNKI